MGTECRRVVNLLNQQSRYIEGMFDPHMVGIQDINNYFNHHRCIVNELQIIDPITNSKKQYEIFGTYWRPEYNHRLLENLWSTGHSFIIHSPYITTRVRETVREIEANNDVSCDAHTYCGRADSKSFHPHSDESHNLIVQCSGQTLWKVWDLSTERSQMFPDLNDDAMIEVVMKPGDAIFIAKGIVHQAKALTDRISVSFPFVPGLPTLQDEIDLEWSQ